MDDHGRSLSRHRVLVAAALMLAVAPAALAAQLTLSPATDSLGGFSSITGVHELPDGRVIVADARDLTLQRIDFRNGSSQQVGHRGSGPGEFQSISALLPGRDGSALVIDFNGRRILRISASGALMGTRTLDVAMPESLATTGPSQVILVGPPRHIDEDENLYFGPGVMERQALAPAQTSAIVRLDARSGAWRRVATIRAWYPGVNTNGNAPFLSRDAWAIAPDGRVARVVAEDYHVEWLRDGVAIARGTPVSYQRVPVTKADRDAWVAERAARRPGRARTGDAAEPSGEGGRSALRVQIPGMTDSDYPGTKPPFDVGVQGAAIPARVTPDGELWVTRSVPAGQAVIIDAFGADGMRRRSITAPPGSVVVGFGRGAVYLAHADSDGLLTLARYRRP
jgi:hypothetical protein